MLLPERMRGSIATILAVVLTLSSGCAARLVRGTKKAVSPGARSDMVGSLAQNAAGAVFEKLTTDERRAVAAELSRELARSATEGVHNELLRALGPDGQGPLGQAIGGAVFRATQAAVFPECNGANRAACIHGQVQALAQVAAVGMMQGVRERLGLAALLLAFAAGALFALTALATWTTLRTRRRLLASPRRPLPT
jgi:hypothetical protein